MEFTMRCNELKCREKLTDRAVVTTCSHIFCIRCSEAPGFATSTEGIRVCPACKTQLSQPDDIVATELNPSEDYKTSILSGLRPDIIMECAARGLSFYSYQAAQEILWQESHARSLAQKHHNLNMQLDGIIQQANSEITDLRDRLSTLQLDQKNLLQRHEELLDAFREKSKAHQHIQKLYTGLKAQSAVAQVQAAASDDAEHELHATGGNGYFGSLETGGVPSHLSRLPFNSRGIEQIHSHQRSGGSGAGGEGGQSRQNLGGWNAQIRGERTYTAQNNSVMGTPSHHRTRLPMPLYASRNPEFMAAGGATGRQPLSRLDPNTTGYTGISSLNLGTSNLGKRKLNQETSRQDRYTNGPQRR